MANEIIAYSLDSKLSCEEAKQIFFDGSYTSYDQMIEVSAKVEQCKLEEYNARNPTDPVVTTMNVDNSGENPKILFNTIRLKDAEKIADISKVLISIGAAIEFDGDPQSVAIVSAMGNFSVDAYLEAAKKNDPLIIFLPTVIPTLKVGKDVFKAVVEGKLVDKVEVTIQDGIDFIKQNPTVWLTGTSKAAIDGIKTLAPKTIVATVNKAEGAVTGLIVNGTELVLSGGKFVTKTAAEAAIKAAELTIEAAKRAAEIAAEEAKKIIHHLDPRHWF